MSRFPAFRSTLPILAIATTPVFAADWSYSVGLHNTIVPEVDSHTLGINGSAHYDHTTASGVHLLGDFELFLDNDKDHLDPDHIPVWWKLNFEAKNRITQISSNVNLDWLFEIKTKTNTVSNIERQVKSMLGIRLKFESEAFHASVKGLAGYYFLEIDDDVAKERGYTRTDFRNSTDAFSIMADASIALGKSSRLYGSAQQWHDGDTWLDNQFTASLRYNVDHWRANSELVLEVEFSEYNLDVYSASEPTTPPLQILPWDNDVFIKFSFNRSW